MAVAQTQTDPVIVDQSDEIITDMVNMLMDSPAPAVQEVVSKIHNLPSNTNKGKKYDDFGGPKNRRSDTANDNADKPSFELVAKRARQKRSIWTDGVLRYFTGILLGRKLNLVIDEDLLAYLQLEAAFLPRTPALARSLANSAKRFFTYYDCLTISWMERTEIILSTVAVAMCVGDLERKAVQFFTWQRSLEINQEVKKNLAKLTSSYV